MASELQDLVHTGKVPFSLTFVTYENGNIVGWCMALVTLTPIFVMVMFATLLVFGVLFGSKDTSSATAMFAAGQLLNEVFSVLLKEFITAYESLDWLSRRPSGSDKSDCGFPSSHSQSIFFFATYGAIFLFSQSQCSPLFPQLREVLCCALGILAVLVSTSRVYLEYHTTSQVLAGAIIGAAAALLWNRVINQVTNRSRSYRRRPGVSARAKWPLLSLT